MKIKWTIMLLLAAGLTACHEPTDPNAQINKEVAAIDQYLASHYNPSDYLCLVAVCG